MSRLNSENRERDEQIKQVHEQYEKRVRDLETSSEDMEQHFGKLLDEKKQEIADLNLHVEALEKQMKAKKQFLEVEYGIISFSMTMQATVTFYANFSQAVWLILCSKNNK